jgi:hypothetical protein
MLALGCPQRGASPAYTPLVLAQPFVDDLPQWLVIGPGQMLDLNNELETDPMYP